MSGALDLEQIDLAELAKQLAERVPSGARRGALVGRTAFRDATVDALQCSELEAERLVDTLVAQHFLVFEAGSPGAWRVRVHAA